MDLLRTWDIYLFEAINVHLSNPVFDLLCPLFRNPYFWTPAYLLIIYYFIKRYRAKGMVYIAGLLLVFAIADSFNSKVLKFQFERIRPCHRSAEIKVIQRVDCGLGYSFPSSHATNHWGISVFLTVLLLKMRERKIWVYLSLLWAFLVCFSQIYVGVHFPIDILAGGIEGSIIGFLIASLVHRVFPFYRNPTNP